MPSTRASVRKALIHVLRTDADLTAFCLDYFPAVHKEFSAGMGLTDKLNTLLSRIDINEVLARLYDCDGSETLQEKFPELTIAVHSKVMTASPYYSSERTYPMWAEPAEQIAKATLTALGYSHQMAFERCLILTTQSILGKALCVKIVNLVGSTRISVQSIPPDDNSSDLISKFFQTFDMLRLDG